ncbi:MAG: peroxiredoxin [Arenicella sp.]|jgi:peroxiredoxin
MMKKLLYFSAFILISIASLSFRDAGYQVGDIVQDFSLKNIDDKMVKMADHKNAKGFIVTFTCNHCPFSKLYEDRIIELHNEFASKGYLVIAINPNDAIKEPGDSFDKMKERASEKAFPFQYLHDESQEIAKAFGATRTPHIFLLQKEPQGLVVKYIGAIDDSARDATSANEKYVKNAINDLLAGKEVRKTKANAIGCTIKWK